MLHIRGPFRTNALLQSSVVVGNAGLLLPINFTTWETFSTRTPFIRHANENRINGGRNVLVIPPSLFKSIGVQVRYISSWKFFSLMRTSFPGIKPCWSVRVPVSCISRKSRVCTFLALEMTIREGSWKNTNRSCSAPLGECLLIFIFKRCAVYREQSKISSLTSGLRGAVV